MIRHEQDSKICHGRSVIISACQRYDAKPYKSIQMHKTWASLWVGSELVNKVFLFLFVFLGGSFRINTRKLNLAVAYFELEVRW